MDLYRVTTVVKEYNGCKNVSFEWFRKERTPRSYAELIENYNPGDYYSEDAIDELFTAQEANALKEYLDRDFGDAGTTTIENVKLPIANNVVGVGAVAVGGGADFYMLDRAPNYPLEFGVWAYFNLRGCELSNGPPGETFRHYVMLVSKDGCRKETQEEARHREDTKNVQIH